MMNWIVKDSYSHRFVCAVSLSYSWKYFSGIHKKWIISRACSLMAGQCVLPAKRYVTIFVFATMRFLTRMSPFISDKSSATSKRLFTHTSGSRIEMAACMDDRVALQRKRTVASRITATVRFISQVDQLMTNYAGLLCKRFPTFRYGLSPRWMRLCLRWCFRYNDRP